MSDMSFRLSKALKSGRGRPSSPKTRERILADLLSKRAAAKRAGLKDLEAKLRNQIRWALPMRPGEGGAETDN